MKRLLGLVVAGAFLATPGPAIAAKLVALKTPSRHVIPSDVKKWNGPVPTVLRANVLLPDGYDGTKRFPVLYLLHGVGDAYDTWAKKERGDIRNTAKGFPGIIVMPEGDRGFYTNWWNDGLRGKPGWERYDLEELIPLVERTYKVRRGRRWHAIAGLSMGGMGATYLGSQRPGYFGAVASFSGFVSHQRPEVEAGLRAVGGVEYTDIFGPMDGFYATGHNPSKLTDNLRHTRLFVAIGDGISAPGERNPGGSVVEAGLRPQNDEFAAAARESGADLTYRPQQGIHDWPYWRKHLKDAIAWGFFKPVVERPLRWTYSTTGLVGDAYGFRLRFTRAPEAIATIVREDYRLQGSGKGSVRVTTPSGRRFTETLPFDEPLIRPRNKR